MTATTGRDSFRMNPVSLGALIGGVVAFIVVGAIVDVLWVALGAVIGGGIGFGIRRFGQRARTYTEAIELQDVSKTQLLEEASRLEIPGRTSMTKDELAQAVAERRES